MRFHSAPTSHNARASTIAAGSGKIDLHSLDRVASQASPPYFIAQMNKNNKPTSYWGAYNPCSGLSGSWQNNHAGPPCNGNSACQLNKGDESGWAISMGGANGDPEGGFQVDQSDKSVTIQYKSANPVRTANVKLICDPQSTDPTSATFAADTPNTENPSKTYSFTLQAMCACPGRCPVAPPPPPPNPGPPSPPAPPAPPDPPAPVVPHKKTATTGVSTGTAMLLVFFLGGGGLMAAGTTFRYKVQGHRGKEAVPFVDFWVALPGLIWEGIVYTYLSLKTRWGSYRGF